MHVDEFIDATETDAYASWFLNMKRLPASLQAKFSKQIDNYKLYCTYKDEKYRITGASRLGDVWLVKDLDRNTGYDLRVGIEECCNLSEH